MSMKVPTRIEVQVCVCVCVCVSVLRTVDFSIPGSFLGRLMLPYSSEKCTLSLAGQSRPLLVRTGTAVSAYSLLEECSLMKTK